MNCQPDRGTLDSDEDIEDRRQTDHTLTSTASATHLTLFISPVTSQGGQTRSQLTNLQCAVVSCISCKRNVYVFLN